MKAAGLKLGDPMNPETEVGPLIRPAEIDRVHEWVTEAVNSGGQLLTGGEKLSDTIYAPTVIFKASEDCRLMTEEVFGPVVCVDPCSRSRTRWRGPTPCRQRFRPQCLPAMSNVRWNFPIGSTHQP